MSEQAGSKSQPVFCVERSYQTDCQIYSLLFFLNELFVSEKLGLLRRTQILATARRSQVHLPPLASHYRPKLRLMNSCCAAPNQRQAEKGMGDTSVAT